MIMALAGQKGGPGKTTCAINIASLWSQRGKRVLLLDADPQHSALDWYTAAQEVEGGAHPTVVYVEGNLKKTCQRFEGSFEHILIDLPGRDARVQREALLAADVVLLPVVAGAFDLWSLRGTLEYVREARELRQEMSVYTGEHQELRVAFVRSRYPVGQTLGREVSELLGEQDVELMETVLHSRKEFARAPSLGLGVVEFAPKSKAAGEVRALVAEVEQRFMSAQMWEAAE